MNEILEQHRVPAASGDRAERTAALDRTASEAMRRIVGHPAFRRVEALWRGVVFLLSRVDAGNKVRVYIADVPRPALERDAGEDRDPERSPLLRLLRQPELGPVADRWGLVVGAYRFGGEEGGPRLARHVAAAARAAGVPWFSEADSGLVGCPSLRELPDPDDWSAAWSGAWAEVRSAPEARWLALALPRFLVREPYGGEAGRRCKTFDFREMPDATGGGSLPWGNPAFACAAVLGRAFARRGWDFADAVDLDLGQMPLAEAGSGHAPVLTEVALDRAAAGRVAQAGLVPLAAFPREARVRVGGFRPVASPPGAMGAWWQR